MPDMQQSSNRDPMADLWARAMVFLRGEQQATYTLRYPTEKDPLRTVWLGSTGREVYLTLSTENLRQPKEYLISRDGTVQNVRAKTIKNVGGGLGAIEFDYLGPADIKEIRRLFTWLSADGAQTGRG